jgi:hypothetical protein
LSGLDFSEVTAVAAAALHDAFELRRNVVNLKKVLLHSWRAAEPLEKELRHGLALHTSYKYTHLDQGE